MAMAKDTTPDLNILEVITREYATLRKSDKKVADVVRADPNWILKAKLAEVAKASTVSEPTVIRFCAAIGCGGYQDFKIKLAQSLAFGISSSQSTISATDSGSEVAGKIFDYTLTSLDWARKKLDLDQINRAVDILDQANRIMFYGFGASGIVARDASQKFPLFGVPCNAPLDSHQQFISATMLQPGDVVVSISNTGATRSLLEITRQAKEKGATVIGITGNQSPLLRFCDVPLIVETLENTDLYTPTISRIAALVVIDILSTCVALRKDPDHKKKIADMKQQLSEMRIAGMI